VQPGFHAFVLLSLVAVGALVTAVTAATGITTEKEAGTWPVLLSTPLSASDVILGKAAGVLRRSAPAWVPAILYVVVYTATGLMEPVVGLYAAGASLGVFLFVAGAGLLVGVHARRTTAAVVLNLALAFALLVVAPLAGAYLNEMMYGERLYGTHSPLLSEIGYATDPLGMIYQVADSFSGYWAPEGHPFTRPFTAWRMWKSDDETSVLSYSLGTGLMYSGLGLYLAALAGVRLRKRIF
jgi:ABC-type transport system involved in multi-copper enzyme maturation permease subunit